MIFPHCKKRANGISSGLAWFVHVLTRVKFFFLGMIFFLDLFFSNPDALEGQETPIDAHPFDAVFRYKRTWYAQK